MHFYYYAQEGLLLPYTNTLANMVFEVIYYLIFFSFGKQCIQPTKSSVHLLRIYFMNERTNE